MLAKNTGPGSDQLFTPWSSCPTVAQGNIATVSVTAPATNAQVWGTTPLSASITAGSVDTVEFLIDSNPTPVGVDTSSPYSINWNTAGVTRRHPHPSKHEPRRTAWWSASPR